MHDKPGPPVGDEPPLRPLFSHAGTQVALLSPPASAVQNVDAPLREGLAHDGERYTLRRTLGRGGMGEVRLYEDTRVGREVAMKVMRGAAATNADALPRFLREARVQGQLEHPSVVPVYDLGVDAEGAPWFTMQRIRGLSLQEVLDGLRAGTGELTARFNRRRLLSAFSTLCLCLDYAHVRGVLHRDLKPANVMLGDFGEVHLLDWGLARVHGASELPLASTPPAAALTATLQGQLMGSPGYMSPEQARGEHGTLTPASDVYSLGAVLFELLTLEPLVGGELIERVHATLRGVERRTSVRAPKADVPPELEQVVLAATEPEVARRTRSARELAEAVERFLDGDRDEARRTELANGHLANARSLASGKDGLKQAEAVSEVMRAIALKPGDRAAVKLLAELLSTVPDTLPSEVESEFERHEAVARAASGRLSGVRYVIWVAFGPLLITMGITSWAVWTAMLVCAGITAAAAFGFSRRRAANLSDGTTLFALSTLSLTLMASVFGPFIVIPAMVATNSMAFTAYARVRRRWLAMISAVPIAIPWLLEKMGAVSPSYRFTGATIEVLPRVAQFPPGTTEAFLLVASLMLALVTPSLMARVRDSIRDKERRLFMHSWLLRRLA